MTAPRPIRNTVRHVPPRRRFRYEGFVTCPVCGSGLDIVKDDTIGEDPMVAKRTHVKCVGRWHDEPGEFYITTTIRPVPMSRRVA